MAINCSVVDAFLEKVDQIVRCMRNGGSLAEIREHAKFGRLHGELITISAAFIHASQNNGHPIDPSNAINTLMDTLVCIAEAQHSGNVAQPADATTA